MMLLLLVTHVMHAQMIPLCEDSDASAIAVPHFLNAQHRAVDTGASWSSEPSDVIHLSDDVTGWNPMTSSSLGNEAQMRNACSSAHAASLDASISACSAPTPSTLNARCQTRFSHGATSQYRTNGIALTYFDDDARVPRILISRQTKNTAGISECDLLLATVASDGSFSFRDTAYVKLNTGIVSSCDGLSICSAECQSEPLFWRCAEGSVSDMMTTVILPGDWTQPWVSGPNKDKPHRDLLYLNVNNPNAGDPIVSSMGVLRYSNSDSSVIQHPVYLKAIDSDVIPDLLSAVTLNRSTSTENTVAGQQESKTTFTAPSARDHSHLIRWPGRSVQPQAIDWNGDGLVKEALVPTADSSGDNRSIALYEFRAIDINALRPRATRRMIYTFPEDAREITSGCLTPTGFAQRKMISGIAAADYDSDGDIDIVAAASGLKDLWFLENDGGDHLQARTKIAFDAGPRVIVASDVDADGDQDVLVVSCVTSASDRAKIYIMENVSTRRNAHEGLPAPTSEPSDLFASLRELSTSPVYTPTAGRDVLGMVVADFDGPETHDTQRYPGLYIVYEQASLLNNGPDVQAIFPQRVSRAVGGMIDMQGTKHARVVWDRLNETTCVDGKTSVSFCVPDDVLSNAMPIVRMGYDPRIDKPDSLFGFSTDDGSHWEELPRPEGERREPSGLVWHQARNFGVDLRFREDAPARRISSIPSDLSLGDTMKYRFVNPREVNRAREFRRHGVTGRILLNDTDREALRQSNNCTGLCLFDFFGEFEARTSFDSNGITSPTSVVLKGRQRTTQFPESMADVAGLGALESLPEGVLDRWNWLGTNTCVGTSGNDPFVQRMVYTSARKQNSAAIYLSQYTTVQLNNRANAFAKAAPTSDEGKISTLLGIDAYAALSSESIGSDAQTLREEMFSAFDKTVLQGVWAPPDSGTCTRDPNYQIMDPGLYPPVFVGDPPPELIRHLGSSYVEFRQTQMFREPRIYTSNHDGMIHAFNAMTGQSPWAFMPPSVLGSARTRMGTAFAAGTSASAEQGFSHRSKDLLDGPLVHATIGCPENPIGNIDELDWRTILIASSGRTEGRLGRSTYTALDITDPTKPPTMLWEYSDAFTGPADLDSMGNKPSAPVVGRVAVSSHPDGLWMVFFSGGMRRSQLPRDARVGMAVYGIDACTGHLIMRWDLPFRDPALISSAGIFPGAVGAPAIVDMNDDGFIDRMYAGDLGGRIWRFELESPMPPSVFQNTRDLLPAGDERYQENSGIASSPMTRRTWPQCVVFREWRLWPGGANEPSPISVQPVVLVAPLQRFGKTVRTAIVHFGTGGTAQADNNKAYHFFSVHDSAWDLAAGNILGCPDGSDSAWSEIGIETQVALEKEGAFTLCDTAYAQNTLSLVGPDLCRGIVDPDITDATCPGEILGAYPEWYEEYRDAGSGVPVEGFKYYADPMLAGSDSVLFFAHRGTPYDIWTCEEGNLLVQSYALTGIETDRACVYPGTSFGLGRQTQLAPELFPAIVLDRNRYPGRFILPGVQNPSDGTSINKQFQVPVTRTKFTIQRWHELPLWQPIVQTQASR